MAEPRGQFNPGRGSLTGILAVAVEVSGGGGGGGVLSRSVWARPESRISSSCIHVAS